MDESPASVQNGRVIESNKKRLLLQAFFYVLNEKVGRVAERLR
jgi:hypothetical protein